MGREKCASIRGKDYLTRVLLSPTHLMQGPTLIKAPSSQVSKNRSPGAHVRINTVHPSINQNTLILILKLNQAPRISENTLEMSQFFKGKNRDGAKKSLILLRLLHWFRLNDAISYSRIKFWTKHCSTWETVKEMRTKLIRSATLCRWKCFSRRSVKQCTPKHLPTRYQTVLIAIFQCRTQYLSLQNIWHISAELAHCWLELLFSAYLKFWNCFTHG